MQNTTRTRYVQTHLGGLGSSQPQSTTWSARPLADQRVAPPAAHSVPPSREESVAINGGLSAWWFHLAAVVTTHEFTNSRAAHEPTPRMRISTRPRIAWRRVPRACSSAGPIVRTPSPCSCGCARAAASQRSSPELTPRKSPDYEPLLPARDSQVSGPGQCQEGPVDADLDLSLVVDAPIGTGPEGKTRASDSNHEVHPALLTLHL